MPDLPKTAPAIEIPEFGAPDVLTLNDVAVAPPGPGEVTIRVEAAGVNRADSVQREGNYPPPPGASDIPGLEAAGTIAALGPQVSGFQIGDPVCALLAGGGYATYCNVPALQVLPIPAGLSMVEAAAIPETFFTVWTNVFDLGRLRGGESFLVHGGSSGIGTAAIPLAKAFGATVFATAGSPEKCQACLDLGADRAINYRDEDFVKAVKDQTGGQGVDLILDMVGADYIPRNLDALAIEGRHVSIAFLNGLTSEIFVPAIMLKRLTLTGSTLRARSPEFKGGIAQDLHKKVWPLLEDGSVKAVVDSTFPLAKAADAHRRIEGGAHIGKIILTVD